MWFYWNVPCLLSHEHCCRLSFEYIQSLRTHMCFCCCLQGGDTDCEGETAGGSLPLAALCSRGKTSLLKTSWDDEGRKLSRLVIWVDHERAASHLCVRRVFRCQAVGASKHTD